MNRTLSSGDIIMDIIFLVIIHFVADYIANKNAFGKDEIKLNVMTYIYIAVMTFGTFFIFNEFKYAIVYSLLNGLTHYYINVVSNRVFITRIKGKIDQTFKLIGLDHSLHLISLFSTYYLMVSI